MKKLLAVLVALGIGAFVITNANAATTVASSFNVTSPGATAALNFTSTLQCMAQVNAPPGSFQATPQFSTDDATWVDATAVNGGSIGQPGVFIGTVPVGPGYAYFRLFFNRISNPMSGQLVCGDVLPPSQGSGSGTVTSVNASPPITSTGGQDPTIGRSPAPGYDACWDLGMTCDNVTDNHVALAANTSHPVITNVNCAGLFVNEAVTALPDGKILTTDNCRLNSKESGNQNQRAVVQITVTAAPSVGPNYVADATTTGFDYDTSHNFAAIQTYWSGTALGTPVPTTAYTRNPPADPLYILTNLTSTAGFQNFDNSGAKISRSDVGAIQIKAIQNGQGDDDGLIFVGVAGAASPAPSPGGSPASGWEGQPAVAGIQITTQAITNWQYLHPFGDSACKDGGHGDTCIYASYHFDHTGTPPPSPGPDQVWEGINFSESNAGSQTIPVDSYIRFTGGTNIGIDATNINSVGVPTASPIPVLAMKANDTVSLNCSKTGGGPYSRYTTCPQTGIEYNGTDALTELMNNSTLVKPQAFAGTCTITSTTGCTATQTVAASSKCTSAFTFDPNISATLTLSIWDTLSSTTLTTHVEFANTLSGSAIPTWNTTCL